MVVTLHTAGHWPHTGDALYFELKIVIATPMKEASTVVNDELWLSCHKRRVTIGSYLGMVPKSVVVFFSREPATFAGARALKDSEIIHLS